MQGPIVDIALLVMLVLFFGRQQSQRPEMYYRLWFVGWIFVLLSYAVWEIPATRPVVLQFQNAIRFDLMLIGTLLFLVSFLTSRERLWKVIVKGMLVGVPVVLVFDALQFFMVSRGILIAAVVAWEAYGLRAAYVVIPRGRVKTRAAIFTLCGFFTAAMLLYLWLTPGRDMVDWALAEVVICSAVLYGGGLDRRSASTWLGIVGFVLWGGFYLWADLLAHGWPRSLQAVYLFWSVPKYFVGFSMIMKTSEDETTEKARAAQEFKQLYEDFRMMFEGHPHPMWIYEQHTPGGGGGQILRTNAAAVQTYGFTEAEFLGMTVADLSAMDDADRIYIAGLYPEQMLRFGRHGLKDGRKIWVSVTENPVEFQGKPAQFLMARDVTEAVQAVERMAHQAHHDVLTGLPNRTLLADRIQQCMARCERDDRKATLLTIDVDHFKHVNDTYGHPVGDECLRLVAARLASKIRQVDTIARVGGEEFAAMVGGLRYPEDAGKIADSLLRVFDEPLQLGDLDLFVTVSIGVAIYPDDATEAETLTRRSDEALYAAKRGGRNRAVFASQLADTHGAEIAA